MRDHEGVEWLPIRGAAARAGVKLSTVYVWADRSKVRTLKIGSRIFVAVPDVLAAELKTRNAYAAQRARWDTTARERNAP